MIFLKHTLLFDTLFAALVLLDYCHCEPVTFYEDNNFSGSFIRVQVYPDYCYNFSPNWNDRVSSVNTAGECIVVYEHGKCEGKSLTISPNTESHNNLGKVNFNDQITSFKPCSTSSSMSSINARGDSEIWNAALEEHNKFRSLHGSPELRGDTALHNKAQKYAEEYATNDEFKHSEGDDVGENLATNTAPDRVVAVRQAVEQWYDEEKNYDYDYPGTSLGSEHFTKVAWKSTQSMGIGVARNQSKGVWIVVALYSPAGNLEGQYEENVSKPVE